MVGRGKADLKAVRHVAAISVLYSVWQLLRTRSIRTGSTQAGPSTRILRSGSKP